MTAMNVILMVSNSLTRAGLQGQDAIRFQAELKLMAGKSCAD